MKYPRIHHHHLHLCISLQYYDYDLPFPIGINNWLFRILEALRTMSKNKITLSFTSVKLFKRMLQMSSAVVPLVVVLAPFDSARPLYYISWTPALHWPPPFLLHLLHSTNHFMLIPGTTTSLTSSWTTSDILPLYLHSTSRGYHV